MPGMDGETIQVVDPTLITPGSDFGPRYRIDAVLGQGGMGRVYRAYDKELDRVVALKVVRSGMAGEMDALKRFKQELLLASKVSHKNILRIHDMGEVNGMKFITMAHVEGSDLQHIIQENPKMPLERMLNFARQFAEALAAAHSEGVLHRDLKPQNILVGKNDQIFISDFGLAKLVDDAGSGMTKTGAVLGTPRYMSPEQVEGKPSDLRSDLYSYGLILYEMAVGDVPFTGESTLKVMYQRIQEKPKNPRLLNPTLPNWYVRIIMRCLEKDPAVRYQNAYEILADLQGAKSGSVSAHTVQIQLPEFAQRRWIGWVAGAVVLVALAFAIPPVRHLITSRASNLGSGSLSGIPPLSSGRYVAILPFHVLGDEASLGYVADGLNEALSAKLFQMHGLHLASDSAVARVKAKDSIEKKARDLGVNLVIDGELQGSADNMEIIINVQNIPEGRRIWSDTFSGNVRDILTIEDKIYNSLISALELKPTSDELARASGHATENIAAYDLYLKGRNAMRGQQDLTNVQAAINFYQDAVNKDPGFALAYAGLSDASLVMYREKKDPFWSEKALAAAQQAQRLNDNSAEVHFALGRVYSTTGKTAEAIAELRRALAIEPNSDDGYRGLGGAYLSLGEKDQALQAYEKAVEINSYYWYNLNQLGSAYAQLGEYDKALASFQRVIELEPDNSFGYMNVGVVYFEEGKYKESIPYFQKSLAIQPSYLTYSNLGSAYFYLKRYADSVPMFEKAVELNPNDQLFMGNLADAYRWSGQRDKAIATYNQAIALAYKELEVNPKDTEALECLALYYGKKGNATQSIDFIERARTINAADVNLIYTQAVVYALANRPDDAMKSLRLAFEKGYSVQEAQNDPELGALQTRSEFGKLVAQFGKSKAPSH